VAGMIKTNDHAEPTKVEFKKKKKETLVPNLIFQPIREPYLLKI